MSNSAIERIVESYVQNDKLVIPSKPIKLTRWGKEHTSECLPNLDKVVAFFGAVIDELCAIGETGEARRIFGVVFDYIISETCKYHRDAPSYSWQFYASVFDAGSPCCMCDAQSELSGIASRNGFSDLARSVVSVHCPASPPSYRREASTQTLTESEWARWHSSNAELLASWDGPAFDYLWTESHTRNR